MKKHCERSLPWIVITLAGLVCGACSSEAPSKDAAIDSERRARTLVLYASLAESRLSRLAREYREASGIQVHFVAEDADVLIDKLRLKEHRPGADVVLLSSATDLSNALDTDILRPVRSATLDARVPSELRDPDGYWYGLGQRVEWIAYDSRTVQVGQLGGYADLADAKWRGQLCLQRSTAGRSRSMIAALIAALGERDAELVVRGWLANFATDVFNNQQELLEAIESGECALGIVSSNEAAPFVATGPARYTQFHVPTRDQGGSWQ